MGATFMNMLPYALGIAISPVPVTTVILTLFSARPRLNGSGFLLGWAMGIAVPAIVVMMLAINQGMDPDEPPSQLASVLRIVLGAVLLVIAIKNWIQRHKPSEGSSKPLLFKLVDAISPWKAWAVGLLFAVVTNPKNMALTVAGCIEISAARASVLESAFLLIIFVVISSLGVAAPVILYLLGGDASKKTIEAWKQWLVLHKQTVMALLFIVFGLSFVVKGLAGLNPVYP
jgi:hypothetical protein